MTCHLLKTKDRRQDGPLGTVPGAEGGGTALVTWGYSVFSVDFRDAPPGPLSWKTIKSLFCCSLVCGLSSSEIVQAGKIDFSVE